MSYKYKCTLSDSERHWTAAQKTRKEDDKQTLPTSNSVTVECYATIHYSFFFRFRSDRRLRLPQSH